MTLAQLIRKLVAAEGSSETAGSRDVIVIVDDAPMPYPDVVFVEQSEDAVILRAKVFREPKT
jgi:hypothetical protein